MERTQTDSPTSTGIELVNYLPGMPTFSSRKSLLERVVSVLNRRRGALRPVYRDDGRSE
jgi:hypothetical protein